MISYILKKSILNNYDQSHYALQGICTGMARETGKLGIIQSD